MRKFILIIISLLFLAEAYLSIASMPVAVTITGCVEKNQFFSEVTDFGTHKVSRKGASRYKIKAVDNELKPVDLSSYEGKRIMASGSLLPQDIFIIEKDNIKILGSCKNKKGLSDKNLIPEKRKLSLKEQEELATQIYEKMAKIDKWDTEINLNLPKEKNIQKELGILKNHLLHSKYIK